MSDGKTTFIDPALVMSIGTTMAAAEAAAQAQEREHAALADADRQRMAAEAERQAKLDAEARSAGAEAAARQAQAQASSLIAQQMNDNLLLSTAYRAKIRQLEEKVRQSELSKSRGEIYDLAFDSLTSSSALESLNDARNSIIGDNATSIQSDLHRPFQVALIRTLENARYKYLKSLRGECFNELINKKESLPTKPELDEVIANSRVLITKFLAKIEPWDGYQDAMDQWLTGAPGKDGSNASLEACRCYACETKVGLDWDKEVLPAINVIMPDIARNKEMLADLQITLMRADPESEDFKRADKLMQFLELRLMRSGIDVEVRGHNILHTIALPLAIEKIQADWGLGAVMKTIADLGMGSASRAELLAKVVWYFYKDNHFFESCSAQGYSDDDLASLRQQREAFVKRKTTSLDYVLCNAASRVFGELHKFYMAQDEIISQAEYSQIDRWNKNKETRIHYKFSPDIDAVVQDHLRSIIKPRSIDCSIESTLVRQIILTALHAVNSLNEIKSNRKSRPLDSQKFVYDYLRKGMKGDDVRLHKMVRSVGLNDAEIDKLALHMLKIASYTFAHDILPESEYNLFVEELRRKRFVSLFNEHCTHLGLTPSPSSAEIMVGQALFGTLRICYLDANERVPLVNKNLVIDLFAAHHFNKSTIYSGLLEQWKMSVAHFEAFIEKAVRFLSDEVLSDCKESLDGRFAIDCRDEYQPPRKVAMQS